MSQRYNSTWPPPSTGFGVAHFRMLQVVRNAKFMFPHCGHVQSPSPRAPVSVKQIIRDAKPGGHSEQVRN